MKMRLGYVSNSSSSSFCIVGFVRDNKDVYKNIPDEDKKDDCGFWSYDYDYYEKIFGLPCRPGIENYYDKTAFGLDAEEMHDDETLLQFKERIFKMCKYPGVKFEEITWRSDCG